MRMLLPVHLRASGRVALPRNTPRLSLAACFILFLFFYVILRFLILILIFQRVASRGEKIISNDHKDSSEVYIFLPPRLLLFHGSWHTTARPQ